MSFLKRWKDSRSVVVGQGNLDAVPNRGSFQLFHVGVVEDASIELVLQLKEDDRASLGNLVTGDELSDGLIVLLPA